MIAVRTSVLLTGVLLVGCASITGSRNDRGSVGAPTASTPTAQELVNYINYNASQVAALEATDLALEVKSGNQGGGLSGTLFCEKPKNFRLRAKAIGKPIADFGSNDQEFWYWISQDNPPYLYHCSYAELARGNVNLPFPFQPDWVLETLGMATLNSSVEGFQIERKRDTFELTERGVSAQGRPVLKVTVFRNGTAERSAPQITQHRLYDERRQLIAQADVLSVKRDGRATTPNHLVLKWPQQKIEMEMKLDGLRVYPTPVLAARAPDLFNRQSIRDLPSFDLARQSLDGQPSSFQRAGAFRH